MLSRVRSKLTYANVMATFAVVLAVGGSAFAVAAFKAPKNSVTSRSIRNGQVKTKDIANGAVKNSKLATDSVTADKLTENSVQGRHIVDGSVTGDDISVGTLRFGCNSAFASLPTGTAGPFQIGNGKGFCAIVIHPSTGRKWSEAADDCTAAVPDSTLADAAEMDELQQSTSRDQGPLTGTTGIWTPDVAGGISPTAVAVAFGNQGTLTQATPTSVTTSSPGPIVCVYQPASKNG
jgi:hypothetical protein